MVFDIDIINKILTSFLIHGAYSYKFLIVTRFLFLPIINCIISIYILSNIDYDNLYFQFLFGHFQIFLKTFYVLLLQIVSLYIWELIIDY